MKKIKNIFFYKNMFFLNNFLNNDRKKKSIENSCLTRYFTKAYRPISFYLEKS